MYGFAVWNEKEQSLMLARDFFGIKPLYYAKGAEALKPLSLLNLSNT